jgi:DNA polymerase III delta prime subunit
MAESSRKKAALKKTTQKRVVPHVSAQGVSQHVTAVAPLQPRVHHAYILSAPAASIQELATIVPKLITVNDIGPEDTHTFVFPDGSVDEMRQLQARAVLAPRGKHALFMVHCGQLSTQAQNALLKLLEDGVPHACFVLSVPSVRLLLPTILSRVQVLTVQTSRDASMDMRAREILHAHAYERIKYSAELLDGYTDADILHCIASIMGIAEEAHQKGGISDSDIRLILSTCAQTVRYFTMNGAAKKTLLEACLLTLPRVA